MYVCMCVCMYVHKYTYTNTYIYIYIYIYKYEHVYAPASQSSRRVFSEDPMAKTSDGYNRSQRMALMHSNLRLSHLSFMIYNTYIFIYIYIYIYLYYTLIYINIHTYTKAFKLVTVEFVLYDI